MVSIHKFLKTVALIGLLAPSLTVTAPEQKPAQNPEPIKKTSTLYKVGLGLAGSASALLGALLAHNAARLYSLNAEAAKEIIFHTQLTLAKEAVSRQLDVFKQERPYKEYNLSKELQNIQKHVTVQSLRTGAHIFLTASALFLIISSYTFKNLWDTIKKERAEAATKVA